MNECHLDVSPVNNSDSDSDLKFQRYGIKFYKVHIIHFRLLREIEITMFAGVTTDLYISMYSFKMLI